MNAAGERAFLSRRRSNYRALWRWIYRAADQFFAGLTHWNAGPAGGGADVSGRGEQRVLPEVVGLPPADLIKQVGLRPAVHGRRCQYGVLELLVLAAHGSGTRARTAP
jgi:hypothetical protein